MWRPLESEPGAPISAFQDAARATLMPIAAHAHIRRVAYNRVAVMMRNGQEALVELVAGAPTPATFNDREAFRYQLTGQAAIGQKGYGLLIHAVIDAKSKAFFNISCEIRWQSDVQDGQG